jgi:GWxTD domain-containing protein
MASHVLRLTIPLSLWLAAGPSLAIAADPTVDTRRFPQVARLLLLPEEQPVLKGLGDEKDRLEFQRIFWARRDPAPATPANEMRDAWEQAVVRADGLFATSGQRGSQTGCGQVFLLLGDPREVVGRGVEVYGAHPPQAGVLRDGGETTYRALKDGSRRPEIWIYRSQAGDAFQFPGGELHIAMDETCRFAEGGLVLDELRRAARARVVRPELAYQVGPDGHLVRLEAVAAATGGAASARSLLAAPRTDFPLAAEPKVVMRGPKGEAWVAGLVRLSPAASATADPLRVSLVAQAADATGQTVASAAREALVPAEADGSRVASWGLSLKPGRYKVSVAAVLSETAQGSVGVLDVEVPDFAAETLVASPLVVYPDEPPAPGAPDARDPYAALQLGPTRLRPRFGNVFTPADSLLVVATLYGAKVDAPTGQASLRSRYSILLKDGKPVARGAEDAFTTPNAVASVGPIPLSSYAPGAYVVRLDVTDAVAKQNLRQEVPFEIRQP